MGILYGLSLGCSISLQLPADVPGNVAEDGPSARTPAPMREAWMEFQVSAGPNLDVGTMSLQKEDSHFLLLCL